MCTSGFAYMYVYVMHACLVPKRSEESIDTLKLKLQVVVSHHMGAARYTRCSEKIVNENRDWKDGLALKNAFS